jgi:hypothetical protein
MIAKIQILLKLLRSRWILTYLDEIQEEIPEHNFLVESTCQQSRRNDQPMMLIFLVENFTHNQLPIIWQSCVHQPMNYQDTVGKRTMSNKMEIAKFSENPPQARFFLFLVLMLQNHHRG